LDKTSPVVEIGGKSFTSGRNINAGMFKQGISPTFRDNLTSTTATLSKNGEAPQPFTGGTYLDVAGSYVLTVTDMAGNTKVVYFSVDTSVPTIQLLNYNTSITTRPITIYASLPDGAFTTVGNEAVGGQIQSVTIATSQIVTFVAQYNGVNTTATAIPAASFNIVAQADLAKYANVETDVNNKIYKANVTFTVPAGATSATLDGAAIPTGAASTCSTEGTHTLIIRDATYTNTVVFVIDKSAPVISGPTAAGFFNYDRYVYLSDGFLTHTIDGTPMGSMPNGGIASMEGLYVLTAWDYAGNFSTLSFTIDKTVPKVDDTYGSGGLVFENGGTYTYADSRRVDLTPDNGTYTVVVNGVQRPGISFFDCTLSYLNEISYNFVVMDRAGNTLYFNVLIDDKGPEITGVSHNGIYNSDRTINFTPGTVNIKYSALSYTNAYSATPTVITNGYVASKEGYYYLTATDADNNVTTLQFQIDRVPPTVTMNGSSFTGGNYNVASISLNISGESSYTLKRNNAVISWYKTSPITLEGKYELSVTDGANVLNIVFSIDRTPPKIFGVDNGGYYTSAISVQMQDELTSAAGLLNGTAFYGGTISTGGEYTLTVTDSAGNSTTIRFTLNVADPVVTGVVDGRYYKTSVVPEVTDGSFTLDGFPFASGSTVDAEGPHRLDVRGMNGQSATISFTIDRTVPIITVKKSDGKTVKSGESVSGTVKVHVTDAHLSRKTVMKNGKAASFGSGTFKFKAKYVITAIDKAGNKTVYKFTIK